MFAVIILGIGFIMIAAIFPVAIQQTQASSDDSAGASIAREAANAIGALPGTVVNVRYDPAARPNEPANLSLFPATVKPCGPYAGGQTVPAVVEPFGGYRWDAIKANLILPSNPRIAYVPFYSRDNNSNVAQLIIVAVQATNQSAFDEARDVAYTESPAMVPVPTLTRTLPPSGGTAGDVYPDQITIGSAAGHPGDTVLVNYTVSPTVTEQRTYRLGRLLDVATGLFALETPDDLRRTLGPLTGATPSDNLWGTGDDVTDKSDPLAVASSSLAYSNLQPVMAYAQLTFPSSSINGQITLYDTVPNGAGVLVPPNAAAQGSYIIVADDYPYDSGSYNPAAPSAAGSTYLVPQTVTVRASGYTGTATVNVGQSNGRIYRLGSPVAGQAGTYELDPTTPMRAPEGIVPSLDQLPASQPASPGVAGPLAKVYIVGLAHSDPTTPNSAYTGLSQAIAAYTTFVSVQ